MGTKLIETKSNNKKTEKIDGTGHFYDSFWVSAYFCGVGCEFLGKLVADILYTQKYGPDIGRVSAIRVIRTLRK